MTGSRRSGSPWKPSLECLRIYISCGGEFTKFYFIFILLEANFRSSKISFTEDSLDSSKFQCQRSNSSFLSRVNFIIVYTLRWMHTCREILQCLFDILLYIYIMCECLSAHTNFKRIVKAIDIWFYFQIIKFNILLD